MFSTETYKRLTLLSVSRLAAHITHDVMVGGLAVPQTMHSSLSASRKLACGTFCGRSGASHVRQFGAFSGTIPLQFIHGPTCHTLGILDSISSPLAHSSCRFTHEKYIQPLIKHYNLNIIIISKMILLTQVYC